MLEFLQVLNKFLKNREVQINLFKNLNNEELQFKILKLFDDLNEILNIILYKYIKKDLKNSIKANYLQIPNTLKMLIKNDINPILRECKEISGPDLINLLLTRTDYEKGTLIQYLSRVNKFKLLKFEKRGTTNYYFYKDEIL